MSAAYEYTDALRSAKPVIWWKAICYHYVRRHRYVSGQRSGDSITTTQAYYERVNSGSTTTKFEFQRYGGVVDETPRLEGLDSYPFTRIKISKQVSFQDSQSQAAYDQQRKQFISAIHRYDDYSDIREGLDFEGVEYRDRLTTCRRNRTPWYATQRFYWCCSALLLSWPLRLWIGMRTAHVKFVVHKRFGKMESSIHHNQSALSPHGRITLVYDEDSREAADSDSEYEMAPSYSFALLLDGNIMRKLSRSRSTFANNVSKYSLLPRSKTFTSKLANEYDGKDDQQELIRLIDPIPKPTRIAPPPDFPMSRLQRLPRVVISSDEEEEEECSTVHENRSARAQDGGVRYDSSTSRVIFVSTDTCSVGSQLSLNRNTNNTPPPSYEEVISMRSLGRRVSQIFDRFRGSQHSLIANEL